MLLTMALLKATISLTRTKYSFKFYCQIIVKLINVAILKIFWNRSTSSMKYYTSDASANAKIYMQQEEYFFVGCFDFWNSHYCFLLLSLEETLS